VRAVPAGSASRNALTQLGRSARAELDESGAFAIGNLPRGKYDLHVVREEFTFYTFALDDRCFPGFDAGAAGLDLVIRSERRRARARARRSRTRARSRRSRSCRGGDSNATRASSASRRRRRWRSVRSRAGP
jgi:hypothetical protein